MFIRVFLDSPDPGVTALNTQENSELTRKKFKVIKLLSQLTGTKRFEFTTKFTNGNS